MRGRLPPLLRAMGMLLLALLGMVLLSFALPIRVWRTGELPAPPLSLLPGDALSRPSHRVWIDTDAACGRSRRTDPDNCFAVLLLSGAPAIEIVGLSTVFGNAPIEVTDSISRTAVNALTPSARPRPPVYRGAAGPHAVAPAQAALRAALRRGPLTIVALGPLTNVAAALQDHPELERQVTGLVAVMGRRPGHLFHPAEGALAGILFGHGPVFRDFNEAKDPDAVATVLAMGMRTVLIPYDAAREVELTQADLDQLARPGAGGAWLAERAGAWLEYWQHDIVLAWIGRHSTMRWPFPRSPALLVAHRHAPPAGAVASSAAAYGPELAAQAGAWLRRALQPAELPLRPSEP